MLYSLTDKLKFNDDPQIEIKDKVISVKSDAETVLALMDAIRTQGEIEGMATTFDILFSEKDKKTIKAMKLKTVDYMKLMEVAIDLALGNDPDEKKSGE
jgi:hypothetical protein